MRATASAASLSPRIGWATAASSALPYSVARYVSFSFVRRIFPVSIVFSSAKGQHRLGGDAGNAVAPARLRPPVVVGRPRPVAELGEAQPATPALGGRLGFGLLPAGQPADRVGGGLGVAPAPAPVRVGGEQQVVDQVPRRPLV